MTNRPLRRLGRLGLADHTLSKRDRAQAPCEGILPYHKTTTLSKANSSDSMATLVDPELSVGPLHLRG